MEEEIATLRQREKEIVSHKKSIKENTRIAQ
jgi:hypothetical protein